jgi:uncharacterized protein
MSTLRSALEPGHGIRLQVSSNTFPRFDPNLNTDEKKYNESRRVVVYNVVHDSKQCPSQLKIAVVKK